MNINFVSSSYPFKSEVLSFVEEWKSDAKWFEVKTSGTTGKPKMIRIQKTHAIASAKATLNYFNIPEGGKAWLCMSPNSIAGKMMIVRSIIGHLDLYITEPSSTPTLPAKEIDLGAMVPMQVKNFIQTENAKNVAALLVGGAPVSSVLWQQIVASEVNAYQTFGSTETLSHIAVRKIDENQLPYRVLENISISVNDTNQLIINAPQIGVCDLLTNDIVHLNKDSSFQWLGRADFVINSGGVKLHPEIIQEKISRLIQSDFFITAQPDESLGQKVILVVEARESSVPVWDFSSVLTRYEIPKSVLFCEKFERTESGKVDQKSTLEKIVG